MILFAIIFSIIISTASLTWGYLLADLQPFTRLTILLGAIWLFSSWRKWRWFPNIGLLVSFAFALYGLFLDVSLFWMLTGTVFALIAWDLSQFQMKLNLLPDREDKAGMSRRRIIRLAVLAVIGVGVGFVLDWVVGR